MTTTSQQSLYLDLNSRGSGGDKLLGPGNVSLRLISPPPGDGVSSATAQGGSGGGIEVSVPTATMTAVPNVSAAINADCILAGGDVTNRASASPNISATATNGAGGVVDVQVSNATAQVNLPTGSNNPPSVKASVGSGTTINTLAAFVATATFSATSNVHTDTDGGGLVRRPDRHVEVSHQWFRRRQHRLQCRCLGPHGGSLGSRQRSDSFAGATAHGGGLFGRTTAHSDSNATLSAQVHISGDSSTHTQLTGNEGMDVRAVQEGVSLNRNSDAIFIGIGPSINEGGATYSPTTNVLADQGVTVYVGPRRSDALGLLVPIPANHNPSLDRLALFSQATDGTNGPISIGMPMSSFSADRARRW